MLGHKLVLVGGKGGVGRSAVTAALAIQAARRGGRVLAVAMTDPIGLASHFGIERLGYRPTLIRPGIEAIAIDRSQALAEYLRIQLHAPRVAPMSSLARGLDALADTVPGIRDIVTIGKVLYEAQQDWDLVVADAPPLGQLISYLRAPRTIAGLVPAGRIRAQAEWMREILEDKTTGMLMVTLPEELPMSETREALDQISAEALVPIGEIVLNRLLPSLAIETEAIEQLPQGPHRAAAELHQGLRVSQQEWKQAIPTDRELPFLFGLLTPGEVAARLADEWETA